MVVAEDTPSVFKEIAVALLGFCVSMLILNAPSEPAAKFQAFLMIIIFQDSTLVL
jgi:hypothetical protein